MRLRFLVLLPALCLAQGCTAGKFDNLQAQLEDLEHQRIDCAAAENQLEDSAALNVAEDVALRCGDAGPQYVAIARDARAAASGASDARTRIGLLRLAASAGAQSGGPEGREIAGAAGEQGRQECQQLPSDQFGAPRDCALLAIMPAMIAHESAVGEVERLKAAPDPLSEADAQLVRDLAKSYGQNTRGYIDAKTSVVEADPTLPASFKRYVEAQQKPILCTMLAIQHLAVRIKEPALADEMLREAVSLREAAGIGELSCS
jgi:hypothetical protein